MFEGPALCNAKAEVNRGRQEADIEGELGLARLERHQHIVLLNQHQLIFVHNTTQ